MCSHAVAHSNYMWRLIANCEKLNNSTRKSQCEDMEEFINKDMEFSILTEEMQSNIPSFLTQEIINKIQTGNI